MKVLHVFTLGTTAESFFDGQFRYLSENGHEITVVAGTDLSKDFCLNNSVSFRKIDIARRIDFRTDFRSIINLLKLIKAEKYDVVVGHTPKGALVAMISGFLAGSKNRIYYRHGLIYTTAKGLKRFIFKKVEQLTSFLSTKIVNVSPSLGALAVKDHLNNENKQKVLGCGTCGGIDTETLFNPELTSPSLISGKRTEVLNNPDFTIGFCGRLCRDKGINELVDGFHLFKNKHPEIKSKLLLIGAFDNRDVLPEETQKTIEHDPDIVHVGRQEKRNLPILYSLMDVFVFPSYREGFGMCVIEASAMEIPVLVSRSHGCVDSIKENSTGQYIEISAQSIDEQLEKLYNNADLRKTLGANGRRFVKENFEQRVMWPRIKEFYNESL